VELAPPTEALVRPWRRATVVATTIAAIELVLLVVGGIVLLGRHLAGDAAPVAAPAKHVAAKPHPAKPVLARPEPVGKPALARSQTAVLVLNGNGRSGAAATEASIVGARGYQLAHVGNAGRADYPTTVVMYRPGYRAEAARLAHDIGVSVFAPLDGMTPSALGAAQLAVVVGQE
jgi:hypothetical protein